MGHRRGWMSPEYLEAIALIDRALGDVVAARVLFGFAITCLVLLVVDVLLLVGVLGMLAVQDQRDEGERPGGSGDDAGQLQQRQIKQAVISPNVNMTTGPRWP